MAEILLFWMSNDLIDEMRFDEEDSMTEDETAAIKEWTIPAQGLTGSEPRSRRF